MADNATHSFWYDGLTTDSITSVNWTRTINYNPTKIDTVNEDVPDSLTDVRVKDFDYEGGACDQTWMTSPTSGGVAGLIFCETLSGASCQQFTVYLDNDFMGPKTTTEERFLACHEVGHTVGLLHTNTGANCMQDPQPGTPELTAHDVNHLATNY